MKKLIIAIVILILTFIGCKYWLGILEKVEDKNISRVLQIEK